MSLPAGAAVVGPTGYSSAFDALPAPADWATFSRAGSAGDNYVVDTDVNATITAAAVATPIVSDPGNPPAANGLATWSSTGMYVQTRATGNRFGTLMGTFVNNTGTNATEVGLSYLFTVGPGVAEEANRGTRVYYSVSGALGSWTNIPAFNVVAVNTGAVLKSTNVTVNWTNGGTLYVLWVDDNASGFGTDAQNQVDDFDLKITGGTSLAIPPAASITSPANGAQLLNPASVLISADASDADGTVANVEFFVDGAKIGEDATAAYQFSWAPPTLGDHVLSAVATDDQGNRGTSSPINVVVFDAAGTPFARVTEPSNGFVGEGPTNLTVSAFAAAVDSVTNVLFLADGAAIGSDTTSPYSIVWAAPFGTSNLRAVAYGADGRRGTSAVVTVTITIPPTNTVAPTVVAQTPAAGATVTNLTSVLVQFSERVINVDAADLLINGMPASSVSGTTSNYTFTFAEPQFGTVAITWAPGHGISDVGYPSNLPFNGSGPGATWNYNFIDARPPTIITRVPAINSTSSNLTQTTITFNEPVIGVDAADLLINSVPASGVSGSGATYTFNFSQPSAGAVALSWAGTHGITDIAGNSFNGAAAGWTVILDNRTILVHSNATWRFVKGTAEASTPVDAWRQLAYDDSGWSNAYAPFFFGDPYNASLTNFTLLSDMQGGYTTIFLRNKFNVFGAAAVSNMFINLQIDDGLIAWINGVEVLRVRVNAGEIPYNGVASQSVQEPQQAGAPYVVYSLTNLTGVLVEGENVIAVHALNQSLTQSSDFGFNAQLFAFLPDFSVVAPRIASMSPAPGALFYLTNITVQFTEGVSGVNASDLLVNGIPASSVVSTTNTTYTFRFAQPAYGNVSVTWAASPGINDFDDPPKAFDGAAAGATFQYTLQNPSAPTVAAQTPFAGASVSSLSQVAVVFSEVVGGVNASDLLINGVPASSVTGSGANYTFTFAQPSYGPVAITWAANHGIADVEVPSNPFDATRDGSTWTYTLVDQTPPTLVTVTPARGSQVTNLTQVTVSFSEAVAGVNASDLRMNGVAAATVSGSGETYTFTFVQANATLLTFDWANNHGIRDTAPVPNSFDASAPGATWSYTTPDTLAPAVANLDPAAFITVRSLSQIRVTFTEPVVGVNAGDLLINGSPALSVSGSGVGPYTFSFTPPPNGTVNVQWVAAHGIADLATPVPNGFAGGAWTYIIDPTATFAGKVVINEVMFNTPEGLPTQEWIELRNLTASPIGLAGWRFTRGVDFVFSNVSIPANGYLVVAADVSVFQANNPGVANVVGGWSGRLANTDETIELETALGEVVNTVHYATEGDWGRRERGGGADPVISIVRSGSTATVTIFGHGYTAGGGFGGIPDVVQISGADQPEYNGLFTVSGVTPTTFNITVAGTPATPATGNIMSRQVVDDGFTGWSWFSAADGFGSSLELINPALPNSLGQNWLVSTNFGGTPGRANSVASANVAPLILDVVHFPPVPRSTQPVSITARIVDELGNNGVSNVTLFYRNHTSSPPGAFGSTNMVDDGTRGDGLAGDGLFGAVLPATANGTVMEFYVQSRDKSGLTRTWPAPTWDTNGAFAQFANALYQVDDEVVTNTMPVLRVVMSGTERAIFPPTSRNSDAEMNNTFISTDGDGTKIRYLAGVRVRGAGSRSRTPPNNRVNIPNDNRWNGLEAVNLNGQFVHAQVMGSAVAQKAGVPASPAQVIQYRINGVNPAPITAPANGSGNGAGYGAFVMVQPVNGDLLADLYPNDGDGNVYRASTGQHNADLSYQGTNPAAYLARGYFKTSNQTENDWSDMMSLTTAFSLAGPDADYLQAMSTNVNVEVWMRYFALGTLINYGETSMFNGRGDDYALYRGIKDPRFVPIGHDFDTVFGQGDAIDNPPGSGYYPLRTNASIYIMLNPPNTGGGGFGGNPPNMPLLRRFFTNEAHAPVFYAELKRLCETVFAPGQLNALFDQMLAGWGNGPTTTTIDMMKAHAQNRRTLVLAQIPLELTISNSLTLSNGLRYTTTPNVTLYGSTHAIETRRVLVNGLQSGYAPWDARWTNLVSLQPGVNRVVVQSLNSNGVEFARATTDIWYDDGTTTSVAGAVSTDTIWSAAQGPYVVTGNINVAAGATLTIQPGTTVYLNAGIDIVVANGGRLIAEGTDSSRIRLSAAPGVATWGGVTINGGASSPESRIAYAHIEGNNDTAIQVTDGTVFLDHLTFGNTARQYVSLDRASFVVQNCVFPATTGSFEPTHGSGGIKAGGRGIFRHNFFGRIQGYNDSLDFTGGNRPGPILQVINNVFMGSDDDLLDLDSTDAWIEGNIFMHTHRNGSPDSSSAISGGADNADTSQVTVIGNLFFDVDQAALAKQGNFFTLINNTIVDQNNVGSQDAETAVVILADDGTAQGLGMHLEGNVIYDAVALTRNVTTAVVTYTNNIIAQLAGAPWTGAGGNNSSADPLLTHIPTIAETTNFTSWEAAQVMWDYFTLLPGSPAIATGPNGRDKGGVIPLGASVSGEPLGTTPSTSATLNVGVVRSGGTIPAIGFPNGSGFTHYRWRLDGGTWSAETPTTSPIVLSSLSSGPHTVEVSGKRDSGFYQDDAVFGPDAVVTTSKTWIVNPSASALRINELLANNAGVLTHEGSTPDAIELYNASDATLSLTGVRLTDDLDNPDKFIFPEAATIPARGYLVVYANNPDGTSGYHLGFGLSDIGDSLHLLKPAAAGGTVIDSVTFGLQLPNRSVGRLADGTWSLNVPTFGSANQGAQTGDPASLRINEWLAIAQTPYNNDFVELYNGSSLPVALGGLYISDEILGWPGRHQFTPLSFVAGNAYLRLVADGDRSAGADHLDFSLNGDGGTIGLFMPDLKVIDCVVYQAQLPNISQGRSPNGDPVIVFFDTPTPGAPNPIVTGPPPFGGALVLNEVLANNGSLVELIGTNSVTPDWVEIYNGTAGTVDLSDWSLTDSTLLSRKFVFPAGAQIAAGGYYRVLCADTQPASTTNTGYGLSASGGAVYLFNRPSNGGALVSSIVYGLQAANLSIGRVPSGSTNWVLCTPTPAAPNNAVPTLATTDNLRINEWMADPASGDDWFEVYNASSLPVALGGLYLTDDLNARTKHPIAPLSFMGAGTNAWQTFIADGNTGSGADHVNFSLRAGGEALGISSSLGTLINGITFTQQVVGVSQGRFPDGAATVVSFPGTDSPGRPNWRVLPNVVINEVLTHTDLPLEDAIELRNLTGTQVDVGGWWLSDDDAALQKYQIPPGTTIPANGFVVIYENVFTNREIAAQPFAISSKGDEVVLSASAGGNLTGYRARVDFGASANGVSFGRYVTSDSREHFVAMSARTFGVDDPATVEQFRTGAGKTNAYPRVGPVVISEIMYHPPDVGTNDNTQDEFIELRNITTTPVSLFDSTNGWRLRDAVDFDFAPGTVIPAGGVLLVVGFDPENNQTALDAFRAKYGLSSIQPIVGPWSGKLANDTDSVELRRPDAPNLGDVPYILVERVRYMDVAPWPAAADGSGFSLQRLAAAQFGNDPVNWVAAGPNPGSAGSVADTDNDGLPNSWENQFGFDPMNPADAALDADGDGLTNLMEYQYGSHPRDASSGLRASISAAGGGGLVLSFVAIPNYSYTVQYADSATGPWQLLQNHSAGTTTRVIQQPLTATETFRMYRVRLNTN